jgi:hypothetical protein
MRTLTTDPEERRWLLIRHFFSSWKRFIGLFEEYERRVKEFSDRYKMERSRLRLSPDDLASLIDFRALEDLRDREVSLLRDISHDLFRSPDATDRFDHHVSIIYHELSALKEEHYTLREEFVREERIEYDLLYREVNRYYPKRLAHIRSLYEKAERRLRELLPGMASDRVLVRSAYLFGADLLRGIYPGGLDELYGAMYPGGAGEGFARAGDSFRESGFRDEAVEAYERCLAVPAPTGRGRAARDLRGLRAGVAERLEALNRESAVDGAASNGAPGGRREGG